MPENLNNLPPSIIEQSVINYGPAIPGVEHLLKSGNEHLLSPDLTVTRSAARDGSAPAYNEAGWRVNGVYADPDTGKPVMVMHKGINEGGVESGAYYPDIKKIAQEEGLTLLNPKPEVVSQLISEEIDPRQQAINEQLSGEWKEHVMKLPDGHAAKEVGEPAVSDVVENPEGQIPEDQIVVPEAKTPEMQIPTPQELFASPEALTKAIRSDDIDPSVKSGLRSTIELWKEADKIDASQALWDTVVKPSVDRMAQSATESEFTVNAVSSQLEQLNNSLQQLVSAADSGDMQAVNEVLQRYHISPIINETLDTFSRKKPLLEQLDTTSVRAALSIEDSAQQERRMRRAETTDLNEQEALTLISEISEMLPDAQSLTDVQKFISNRINEKQQGAPNWRAKYDAVRDAVLYARTGVALEPTNLVHAMNELGLLQEAMARGRFDAAQIDYVNRSIIAPLLDDFDATRRFIKNAVAYAAEIA